MSELAEDSPDAALVEFCGHCNRRVTLPLTAQGEDALLDQRPSLQQALKRLIGQGSAVRGRFARNQVGFRIDDGAVQGNLAVEVSFLVTVHEARVTSVRKQIEP